ncbi:hypothetical protein JCM11251_006136 [Rhodosporidiobolus azoricus]
MAALNKDTLTPERMLALPRPATALLSPDGHLALWPSSTYDFTTNRTDRSVHLVEIPSSHSSTVGHGKEQDPDDFASTPPPRPFLSSLASLDLAWLDPSTVLFLRPSLPSSISAFENDEGKRVDVPEGMSDAEWGKVKGSWAEMEGGEGTEVWAKEVGGKGEEYLVGKLPVADLLTFSPFLLTIHTHNSISNLKTLLLPPPTQSSSSPSSPSSGALLSFSAPSFPRGTLFTYSHQRAAQIARAEGSDAKTYDGLFARHWDEWEPVDEGEEASKETGGRERMEVHVIRLERAPMGGVAGHGPTGDESDSDASLEDFEVVEKPVEEGSRLAGSRWKMQTETLVNEAGVESVQPKIVSPLKGTKLECPVKPFGDSSDWSLSPTHILFHSKSPLLNPAYHTRHEVYLSPFSPSTPASSSPRQLTLGNQGATASPVLSPDGKRAAWLQMEEDGYEADRNRVVVYELAAPGKDGKRWVATPEWDRSPSSIVWAPKGDKLYLTAEDEGHVKVFMLEVPVGGGLDKEGKEKRPDPVALTEFHAVSGVEPLPLAFTQSSNGGNGKEEPARLLLTTNSLRHPNRLSLLSINPSPSVPPAPPSTSLTALATLTPLDKYPFLADLHEGEEFTFAGDKGEGVHGWITFPPALAAVRAKGEKTKEEEEEKQEKKKKYPLAFLCHGGPQSAWNDGWSTRWNPSVFAAKGYVTVAINRTGSTGFGQAFCDRIKGDWGGAPFRDLVAGLQFVKTAYPEIDPDRTACLGASYGGFMVNFIQGHNEQMGFKALVCHDGVFSPTQTWNATEELYFPEREFGGLPWEVPENYQKWSPANFVSKWATPQLVIHGSRDYRLVEGEGLGVFNTLQRLHIPSRLVIFPSENHWVLKPNNSRRWHKEVFRWIDEWTAPSASSSSTEPPSSAANSESKPTIHTAPPETPHGGYEVEYRQT